MAKSPKPFVFELLPREIAQLPDPHGAGEGAALCRLIKEQLSDGQGAVALTDAQMGLLIRNMVRDGDPFHEGMYRAFSRSVYDLLALHLAESITRSS